MIPQDEVCWDSSSKLLALQYTTSVSQTTGLPQWKWRQPLNTGIKASSSSVYFPSLQPQTSSIQPQTTSNILKTSSNTTLNTTSKQPSKQPQTSSIQPQYNLKQPSKQPQTSSIQPQYNLKHPQYNLNTTSNILNTTSIQPQYNLKQPQNNLKTKLQLFVFLYFYYLIIKYLLTLVITLEL